MRNPTPDSCGWYLDEYDAERFWSRVNFYGGTDHEDDPLATAEGECWVWRNHTTDQYPKFILFERSLLVHRVAYMDAGKKIPEGMILDHLCRKVGCVRPSHLEPVTQTENVRRGKIGNKTHCPHGHEYTAENTVYVKPRNVRYCRTCLKASRARSYERRKAAAAT